MAIKKCILPRFLNNQDLPQIIAIIISCIPGFTTGLIIAWPSPSIPKITKDKDNYNITDEEASYFSSLNTIGPIILSVFLTKLCDVIGRKRTLMLSAIPHALTWLMTAFCTDVKLLYIARAVGGIGDTFMYNALPMYIGEISTPKVRGVWGNGLICSAYIGQFAVNAIGSYCTIQVTALICLAFPVTFLIMFWVIPESPYYYAMSGDYNATLDSLKWLRGTENVEAEFQKLKAVVKRQMSETGTWRDVITIESNRKAWLAGSFLRISQNFSGILSFSVYSSFIFENAGHTVDPKISAILYTGLTAVCYLVACNFADKMGRRKSYIISIILTAIPLIAIGVYFVIKQYFPQINMGVLDFIPLVCMIVFIVLASLGIGLVPTLMLGELFSASVKVKSLSVVSALFSLSFFSANNLFYYVSRVSICGPFFIFGCCNILSAVAATVVIPETKGKTLEEIQQLLKSGRDHRSPEPDNFKNKTIN